MTGEGGLSEAPSTRTVHLFVCCTSCKSQTPLVCTDWCMQHRLVHWRLPVGRGSPAEQGDTRAHNMLAHRTPFPFPFLQPLGWWAVPLTADVAGCGCWRLGWWGGGGGVLSTPSSAHNRVIRREVLPEPSVSELVRAR